MTKHEDTAAIHVHQIEMGQITFHIVGTTPFIPHAMSFKAIGSLLMPPWGAVQEFVSRMDPPANASVA